MTADSTLAPATTRRPVPAPDGLTATGAVVALGCTLVGQYVETPWRSGSDEWGLDFGGNGGWAALGVMLAFVVVVLALVTFAGARARAVPPDRSARRALLLACLGVVTIAVFWTGAPAVLAGGAAGLALDVRRRTGRTPAPAAAALVLAALTGAAAVVLAVTG